MTNPNIATTMEELLSPKQLTAIRAICNVQRINAETYCMTTRQCRPECLSKQAASRLIGELKERDRVRLEVA